MVHISKDLLISSELRKSVIAARLINLLQDYLIIFMQLSVQFVKLFRVLRRPEDFSTKWPPKMSRDRVAMETQLKNPATHLIIGN